MKKLHLSNKHIVLFILMTGVIFMAFILLPRFFNSHYTFEQGGEIIDKIANASTTTEEIIFHPSYVKTPEQVKGIYMTSWVAGDKSIRSSLVDLADQTEINSVIIDIKDYSGKIVFPISEDSPLKKYDSEEIRVSDMQNFIEELHKKGIYVIGRIAVFQDAYFVKIRPDLAVKNLAGTAVWKDRKGISWIDVGSKEYWDYIIDVAKEARKIGFDEINFDYIRFPSDGNMQDISFPYSSTTPKEIVLKNFFQYLSENLKESGLKTSADLFGMTTTASDDMGIGQILENTLPYFDYVSPMVYPSHYPPTFIGFQNPEEHPYEIVKYAMQSAIEKADKMNPVTITTEMVNGTTTEIKKIEDLNYKSKLRPWLQDFGLKQTYGPEEVRAQIQATYDVGLDSWMLWSASNKYTKGSLEN